MVTKSKLSCFQVGNKQLEQMQVSDQSEVEQTKRFKIFVRLN